MSWQGVAALKVVRAVRDRYPLRARPLGVTQARLVELMSMSQRHVNGLCAEKRTVTALAALLLSKGLGSPPEFLSCNRPTDLREGRNAPEAWTTLARARSVAYRWVHKAAPHGATRCSDRE